jgi:2OG-Fe(II) oxygenase superfamily
MTAKQILDAFSETLMQDERILSPRERELLRSLLQNSRTASSCNPETQRAVDAAIAQSVGETVAQRAFGLLGGSIVQQILARSEAGAGTEGIAFGSAVELGVPQPPSKVPQPPSKVPQPPGHGPEPPSKVPQPPGHAPQPPGREPQPPSKVPQPPSRVPQPPSGPQGVRFVGEPALQEASPNHTGADRSVGVLDPPAMERAQCVVLDEFLTPQELNDLVGYALLHEAEFKGSEVISPGGEPGVIDYNHRRSRVLMDLGKHEAVILERVRGVLPAVLDQLGLEEFPIAHVEAQITASNDGDFFRAHSDDADEAIASRHVTFVYFFHREPQQFEGGELRLHDTQGRSDGGRYSAGSYQSIAPQQNQIVFFPCSVLHEITPVECPSRAFADSRFTLNGWLHK